ncbi:aldo/keto reductase [Echinicola vietnamensis]|uniref:Putative oxidoreductase, aryl-alcohol dehydrogenase like protein n=1 Tax=Echinicola vietnamensis (strain DSM 17526 / LMG 23754 / KMM 6221) TaxID=926556 RepID=L0G1R8_ECHVK|nr:aldo/keto reductase [Echinicola vietnamensis]AGA78800.1 putative oxidoreductase, aryl-alcohol dehydrogenase like protein [Echinicola vietnamensis DSM 17526]
MNSTQIGLGMAALGRPEYININPTDQRDKSEEAFYRETLRVLDEAYRLGVRYFDTAASYGKGETFLLKWHQKRQHPDVIFGSKWGYTYTANWELGYDGKHEVKEHSLEKLEEQWSYSQKLCPALGVYHIHSATLASGVLENSKVLEKLAAIKRTTGVQIGLSSSGPAQQEVLEKAMDIAIDDTPLFDTFQVTFNVLEQATCALLKYAQKNGVKVLIKEAMANGRIFPNDHYPHYKPTYSYLSSLADKYQVGIDAIALRFCMDKIGPAYVLSGASSIPQLTANLKASTFKLTTTELDKLSALSVDSTGYWDERSLLKWN